MAALYVVGCVVGEQVEGTGPKTRSGHSGVPWQHKALVIVGGMNMALETFFDDVWSLFSIVSAPCLLLCGAVRWAVRVSLGFVV